MLKAVPNEELFTTYEQKQSDEKVLQKFQEEQGQFIHNLKVEKATQVKDRIIKQYGTICSMCGNEAYCPTYTVNLEVFCDESCYGDIYEYSPEYEIAQFERILGCDWQHHQDNKRQ